MMEDSLKQLVKETAKTVKYAVVHKACQDALELIDNKDNTKVNKPYHLRGRCLEAFQTALESKSPRLASFALNGIQHMIKDERMQSIKDQKEEEDQWFPIQILNAVHTTSSLPEDIQVDIMRLLLNMTLTLPQCMSAPVIVHIAKLCFDSMLIASRQTVRNFILNTFLRMIHLFTLKLLEPNPAEVMIETYSLNGHCSVRTAVKATFTQLLSTLAEKLSDSDSTLEKVEIKSSMEFTDVENQRSLMQLEVNDVDKDVILVLQYLCEHLSCSHGQGGQAEPLLLEGILTLICKLPLRITDSEQFHDLVWQKLCPSLISILANPMTDKTVILNMQRTSNIEELGRGSGCSSTVPGVLVGSAKTIYTISMYLVRAVGKLASLRPVLESLFHRMLLYPPPAYRLDAIKALRPLVSSTQGLLVVAGPMASEMKNQTGSTAVNAKKKLDGELRLLKIIIDSLQECCHCNDSNVAIASVELVNDLLTTVEQLVKGQGISPDLAAEILKLYGLPEDMNDLSRNASTESIKSTPEFKTDVVQTVNREDSNHQNHGSGVETGQVIKNTTDSTKSVDCKCGKKYVEELEEVVKQLLHCSDIPGADQLILEFSSKFCSEVSQERGQETILNADAVYVTTYAVLQLSFRLWQSGYYETNEKSLPVSQNQFIEEILSTGLLLYISRSWLSEVFHEIISSNVFMSAGCDAASFSDPKSCTLAALLTDLNGLSSTEVGGQMLAQFQKSDNKTGSFFASQQQSSGTTPDKDSLDYNTQSCKAGMYFAKKVLTFCWDGILDVLSVLTSERSSCGITGSLVLMFTAKEESRKAREAICVSLEGLQKAVRLSCILGLQNRCGAVFAHLASASCVVELEDIKRERQQQMQSDRHKPAALTSVLAAATKPRLARLHAAHALSMDVLLSIGLEIGSHSIDCWQNVFRCCAHISELEHTYFSRGNNSEVVTGTLPRLQKQTEQTDVAPDDDGLESVDIYSTVALASEPVAPTINVRELIHQSSKEAGWDSTVVGGGVLSPAQASKVLCGLSQEVDRLYEDAAHKLNMKSLLNFLSELCRCSSLQLSSFNRKTSAPSNGASDYSTLPTNALHLYRLGDIMSKCVGSDRPLLHIMRAWSVVSQHLVEAACHRDRSISKKAVACIHEVVTTLLSCRPELPHFHFNEALCKPFENLLCLELCDGDVQDQIVCSICELVEACTSNIKSGWKPVFGALRAVKIEYTLVEEVNEARQRHVAAVLDVFNVFLGTDNVLVFANAAVDCILCLLKYVRGPGEFEKHADDSDSENEANGFGENAHHDLCLPALRYLKQCADYLASMWLMPNCPLFVGAQRIHSDMCHPVEATVLDMDIDAFRKPFIDSIKASEEKQITEAQEKLSSGHPSTSHIEQGTEAENGVYRHVLKYTEDDCHSTDSEPTTESKDSVHSNDSEEFVDEIGEIPAGNEVIPTSNIDLEKSAAIQEGVVEDNDPAGEKEMEKNTEVAEEEGREEIKNAVPFLESISETLADLDNRTGALRVYFLLIEGLASAVSSCPKNYQPQTLEMLFELMRLAAQVPGPRYAFYCLNMLLLPTLQSWIRRGKHLVGYWDSVTIANCKHYTGLCVDLVVEFIIQYTNETDLQSRLELTLHQQLMVLVEFIAEPLESLSRLGCSCIRHCVMNCGPVLTERMWQISISAIQQAFDVTLFYLRQLMTPFHENSDNFYGDVGQVKVVVRLDSTSAECDRLQQLGQQVFLLDSQRRPTSISTADSEDKKSFVFLIHSPDGQESSVTRVPFRNLIVGLVSHQLLVQSIGSLLLKGSKNMVDAEKGIMVGTPMVPPGSAATTSHEDDSNLIHDSAMPGILGCLSSQNVFALLKCLFDSYSVANRFDARPGLKFLVQKVLRADVAANMYRQSGISFTLYMHVLLEIVSHQDNICVQNVKGMLLDRLVVETAPKNNASCSLTRHQKMLASAKRSEESVQKHMAVFVCILKEAFDEACSRYVDLYLEKEGPNISDRLSQSVLVFLLAEPEELPSLKRDKSLKEMVAEKLRKHTTSSSGDVDSEATSTGKDNRKRELRNASNSERSNSIQLDEQIANVELKDPLTPQKHRPSMEDRVYTVATDQTIKSLMGEYRKRKQAKSMPSTAAVKPVREDSGSQNAVDKQIEEQQRSSIVKDSEAHLRSWVEMLCNALQLLHQLPDHQYHALLPIAFTCITQLTLHCKDPQLRQALSQWTRRIGQLFGFSGPGD